MLHRVAKALRFPQHPLLVAVDGEHSARCWSAIHSAPWCQRLSIGTLSATQRVGKTRFRDNSLLHADFFAMHATMLADLASTIALHGPTLLSRSDAIPAASLQQYWVASRKRCSRWHETFALYRRHEMACDAIGIRAWWHEQGKLMEEVLVSDILTRVYAAVAAALDSESREPEISPVAHSIYLSHLEARNRVLSIMVRGQGTSVDATARLNRLRKTVERWCDILIGQIAAVYPEASRYGTTLERTTAFAEEVSEYAPSERHTAGWLMSAAMRDSLSRKACMLAACPQENSDVCDAVLVCLRPDMFDSCGTMQSLWLHRLIHGTKETDSVLTQLLSPKVDDNGLLAGYEAVRDSAFSRRMR